MALQTTVEHRLYAVHVPVFAAILKRLVAGPHLENDVERLARHAAVLAVHAVDIELRPVARQTAGAHAEHEATLGNVIHEGDATGKFRRVVIGQQMCTGREFDALGAQQRLRDENVGRRVRLPWCGEMFAYPGFGKAQAIA